MTLPRPFNDHPIHLKRKYKKKKKKQYTRELKYDHQHQSVSHFEKYMYLLLFSLNYIVIPDPVYSRINFTPFLYASILYFQDIRLLKFVKY